MNIGDKIRELRLEKNMTLEELANRVSTTRQTINKYEKGIVTNIPYDRLIGLANALGCTPAYLMGWDEKSSPIIQQATEFALRQKKIDKLPPEAVAELDNYIDYLLSKYSE